MRSLVLLAAACAHTSVARTPDTTGTGTIVVSADVAADVFIDGNTVVGKLPLREAVAPGYHEIELHARNGRHWWQAVVVAANHDVAIDAKLAAPDEPQPSQDDTPYTLQTEDVENGLDTIRARLDSCARQAPHLGSFNVRFTIAGATGRVIAVDLFPPLLGSRAEACVGSALRAARFPTFRSSTLTVTKSLHF
jgi:hypothetical protein